MTDNQLKVLIDFRDDEWKYGTSNSERSSLVLLHKFGLVDKRWTNDGRVQWKILPEGLKVLKELAPQILPPGMHVFTDANGPNE